MHILVPVFLFINLFSDKTTGKDTLCNLCLTLRNNGRSSGPLLLFILRGDLKAENGISI